MWLPWLGEHLGVLGAGSCSLGWFVFAGPRAVRASEQRGSPALGLIICERFCTLKAEPSPSPLEDGKTLSVINSGMLFSLFFCIYSHESLGIFNSFQYPVRIL